MRSRAASSKCRCLCSSGPFPPCLVKALKPVQRRVACARTVSPIDEKCVRSFLAVRVCSVLSCPFWLKAVGSNNKPVVHPRWITSYCLGQQKKEKFGMQFFLRFEPGFSALVFHGVSFTHGGCFISGCHVQLQFAPAPSHDSWLMKILIPPARPVWARSLTLVQPVHSSASLHVLPSRGSTVLE